MNAMLFTIGFEQYVVLCRNAAETCATIEFLERIQQVDQKCRYSCDKPIVAAPAKIEAIEILPEGSPRIALLLNPNDSAALHRRVQELEQESQRNQDSYYKELHENAELKKKVDTAETALKAIGSACPVAPKGTPEPEKPADPYPASAF